MEGRSLSGRGGISLSIEAGRIHSVEPRDLDSGPAVLPGLVDTHVHINEPGRTHWEGFDTATRAAAAGGITTVVDMPLNCIPATTSPAALEEKRRAASDRSFVDLAFWGGIVPGKIDEIEPLIEAGVAGFKAFLIDSGVEEFPPVGEAELRRALPILARHRIPLLVHAELAGPIEEAGHRVQERDPTDYVTFVETRPPAAELEAIRLLIRLCREYGAPVHIVHLACGEAVPEIARAQEEGLPLSAETCPHYLGIDVATIPPGATHFKCCPPIRDTRQRELLWEGLASGVIGLVVSDHSPCPPEMKRLDAGDFLEAWGGIASLQLTLAAVWTEASKRGFRLADLARWMSEAPARLAGLDDRKGRLAPGFDADVVLFDPDACFRVEPERLHHRHPLTPWAGRELRGVVRAVYLRGEEVAREGEILGAPRGQLLRRRREHE
ncbi:MAG: allantoinase AllB [Deltaproteobacteria bacterium]|nr:MAG: allantoinase AllB [Deltaproteobacteria bacterium]